MEIEENSVGNLDAQEEEDSSVVDVENVEVNNSASEENVPQEEPASCQGTSSETVRGKENLPPEKKRLVRLPLSRIKQIMKMDPDVNIVSQDAVFLATKATELFLEYLGRESAKYTHLSKRKTVLKRDVDAAIDSVPHLCFLEGALEQ